MTTRTKHLLFSACFALLALAAIVIAVSALLRATPRSVQAMEHEGQVAFSVDRASILPGQCIHVRWKVDGIQAVYVNGTGQAGAGELKVCPKGEATQRLRVVFKDDTIRTYSIMTDVVLWKPIIWLPLALGAALLALAVHPWLPVRRQVLAASVLILFGAVVLLSLVYRIVFPGDIAIVTDYPNSQVYFASDHRWLASPVHCTTLHWDVEGVQEVHLGSEGKAGQGVQQVCPYPDKIPVLRVVLPDGTSQTYPLPIHSTLDRHGLIILAAGLGLIFVAADVLKVPPAQTMITTAWQAVISRATNPALRIDVLQVLLTIWIFGIMLMLWVISGRLGQEWFLNAMNCLQDLITDLFHVSFG